MLYNSQYGIYFLQKFACLDDGVTCHAGNLFWGSENKVSVDALLQDGCVHDGNAFPRGSLGPTLTCMSMYMLKRVVLATGNSKLQNACSLWQWNDVSVQFYDSSMLLHCDMTAYTECDQP